MPIPAQNTPWPPAPWDYAYRSYAENDAWYTGDTDALEKLWVHCNIARVGGVAA